MKFSNYLSKLIFGLVLFLSFNSFSQQQQVQEIKCTMDHREIMRSQSFSEDDPQAEIAREMFTNFISTINLAYNSINSNSTQELQVQIAAMNALIQDFQTLGLNYIMFDEDIDFILNYN